MPSNDIAHCNGDDCVMKQTCWRYLCPTDGGLFWILYPVKDENGDCKDYWGYENDRMDT